MTKKRNTVYKTEKYGFQNQRNTCAKLPQGRGNKTGQMVLLAGSHSPSRFERNTVKKGKEIWYTKKRNTVLKKEKYGLYNQRNTCTLASPRKRDRTDGSLS